MNYVKHLFLYCILSGATHIFAMNGNHEIHVLALEVSRKTNEESLFNAALNDDATAIKKLLEQNKVDINARRDEDGKTAVCIAASRGKKEALQELLRNEADVNLPDEGGWTPLKKAANYGYLGCARLLLAAGARPNQADKQDYTPLLNARQNLEMTRLLLGAGADPNHSSPDGKSALYIAVADSNFDIVRLLVEHGATDLSRCKSNGFNARDLANANAKERTSSFPGKTADQKCAEFLNEKLGK